MIERQRTRKKTGPKIKSDKSKRKKNKTERAKNIIEEDYNCVMCDGFWSGAAEEEYWIKWKKCGVIFVIFLKYVRYVII